MADESQPCGADYVVRETLAADAPRVQQLLQSIREASNWSEQIIRNSLAAKGAVAFLGERGESIVGCVFGAALAGEAEILNLAVHPDDRQKGIATSLVRHLLERWQQQEVQRVFLEVRESNTPAIGLYQGMGFKQVGRRRKYYANPEEDALILEHCRTAK